MHINAKAMLTDHTYEIRYGDVSFETVKRPDEADRDGQ